MRNEVSEIRVLIRTGDAVKDIGEEANAQLFGGFGDGGESVPSL